MSVSARGENPWHARTGSTQSGNGATCRLRYLGHYAGDGEKFIQRSEELQLRAVVLVWRRKELAQSLHGEWWPLKLCQQRVQPIAAFLIRFVPGQGIFLLDWMAFRAGLEDYPQLIHQELNQRAPAEAHISRARYVLDG